MILAVRSVIFICAFLKYILSEYFQFGEELGVFLRRLVVFTYEVIHLGESALLIGGTDAEFTAVAEEYLSACVFDYSLAHDDLLACKVGDHSVIRKTAAGKECYVGIAVFKYGARIVTDKAGSVFSAQKSARGYNRYVALGEQVHYLYVVGYYGYRASVWYDLGKMQGRGGLVEEDYTVITDERHSLHRYALFRRGVLCIS